MKKAILIAVAAVAVICLAGFCRPGSWAGSRPTPYRLIGTPYGYPAGWSGYCYPSAACPWGGGWSGYYNQDRFFNRGWPRPGFRAFRPTLGRFRPGLSRFWAPRGGFRR